jgi:hypothetical protein
LPWRAIIMTAPGSFLSSISFLKVAVSRASRDERRAENGSEGNDRQPPSSRRRS